MKILFLSLLFKKEDESYLLRESRCGLQGAANAFQWALIEGLDKNLETPIQLLNSLPIGTYPRYYKKFLIHSEEWEHHLGTKDKNIGFINFIVFKQLIRKIRYIKEIDEWINCNKDEKKCILLYDLYTPYLKAIKVIKKKYPEIQTCVIVTDLPNEFGFEKNDKGLMKYLHYYDGNCQLKLSKIIDKFVLLTDHMKTPLNIENKPYVVVEGVLNNDCINTIEKSKHINEKIILYTGTLNKQFGLEKLLNVFTQIDKNNYKLWICGNGDMKSEIELLANKDSRISYFGYLARNQILKLQRFATVLINPRTNDSKYTSYSFPSKTIEYLASGTPLIAYKLNGIPDEYDNYIYYVKDSAEESLKEKIIEVCEKKEDEIFEFGRCAQNFIIKEKNCYVQAEKIIKLINS